MLQVSAKCHLWEPLPDHYLRKSPSPHLLSFPLLFPSQHVVAHTCTPNYKGGRDQKNCGSRTAQAGSFQDPISTNSWAQWYMPVIPSYSGGWDQEDQGSSPSWAKFGRPHLIRNKLGVVVCTYHPSYGGKHKLRGSWSAGVGKSEILSPK
jgi:hypothetical protein